MENPQTRWLFVHGLGQTADSWKQILEETSFSRACACPQLSELMKGRAVDYPNVCASFCEYCGRFPLRHLFQTALEPRAGFKGRCHFTYLQFRSAPGS